MKRTLAFVLLLAIAKATIAQESDNLSVPARSTKSYLIADPTEKNTDFLKEKCQQANLFLGLPVLANRIPTDSKLVTPRPSKHLLKQGILQLQLPLNETQNEFAVYHSDLFSTPSTINVLQVDDELITFRTMETTGNIHLLYHCVRGAYGTRKSAHSKNALVYKLWDTPERTLLPDLKLQDQMSQAEAQKLAQTDYDLLIFNNLQSYAYNDSGDIAIQHFLDTMRKYNPEKHLQADLLTPASRQYLSRVNENQLWNESMRTKIVETLTERQAYYIENQIPWMIGNFQILLADKNRKATPLEDLEWLLSKSAAFEAGFGLIFSVETMKKHGLTDAFLNAINLWETLRLSGAFTEAQKEQFKDPYGNWHIEKSDDSTYLLYPQHISRRYFCNFADDNWTWNSHYKSRFALQICVEGKGSISDIELMTPNGTLFLPCTLKTGQYLLYDFDGLSIITSKNFNKLTKVIPQGEAFLDEGSSEVSFRCKYTPEDNKMPEVTVKFFTRGEAEAIFSPQETTPQSSP